MFLPSPFAMMAKVGSLGHVVGLAMDNRRFDDWARALATGTSRRSLVRALFSGVAGTALAVLSPSRPSALALPCRGPGRLCVQTGTCCSDICDPATHHCVCQ